MSQEQQTLYILLTNVQPHAIRQRETMSLADKILKSIRSGKEERWHDNNAQPTEGNRNVAINLGLSLQELKDTLEKKTGKTVQFMIRKDGLDIYPSKDIIEKADAIRKKRKYLTRVWRDDALN